MLHTKFQLNPTSGSGEENFFRFSEKAPLRGPTDRQCPHLYNLRSTSCPMLHTNFQLNPTNGSGENVENRFLRLLPLWPYWIVNHDDMYKT